MATTSHWHGSLPMVTEGALIEAQIDGATIVYTDEGATSKGLGRLFDKHESVNQSIGEYVRGNVHTNDTFQS